MKAINAIKSIGLSFGLIFGLATNISAHTTQIHDIDGFYDYYGTDFADEQKDLFKDIFTNIDDYFGPDGLENAQKDGFIPLTPEWEKHGIHWFTYNPDFIDITNMQANPIKPAGLNFTHDGRLAAVFWAQELYVPLVPVFQGLQENSQLENLIPEQLTQLYTNHKETTETPDPTIFDIFPDAVWHQHKNVIIEGLYTTDIDGNLDPQQVNFRQSLSDADFIQEILNSLADPNSIIFPLEPAVDSFPPFNRGVSAGFHMIHLWVGQGNHEGPWAGTNSDLPTSPQAISESITFEDGSGGHGHHGHGHDTKSTPEPTSLLSLVAFAIFGIQLRKKGNSVET